MIYSTSRITYYHISNYFKISVVHTIQQFYKNSKVSGKPLNTTEEEKTVCCKTRTIKETWQQRRMERSSVTNTNCSTLYNNPFCREV